MLAITCDTQNAADNSEEASDLHYDISEENPI